MDNKTINITVSGLTASGKSRMTYIIKKYLKDQGFNVDVKLSNYDYTEENDFDKHMLINHDEALSWLKDTRKIVITEKQVKLRK